MAQLSINLFCRVVDNFGDIGVCWRLARQLAQTGSGDHGAHVWLYVDDFTTFARIEPRLNPDTDTQTIAGVHIIRWDEQVIRNGMANGTITVGDAVIEAFACDPPDFFIQAMRSAKKRPVWMDLEYLSAEDWVDEHHAIISVHPMTGMKKTLFFPGFTERTGGLLRENGLHTERDLFQQSVPAQNAWRTSKNIPEIDPHFMDVSLFCYPNAPLERMVRDIESCAEAAEKEAEKEGAITGTSATADGRKIRLLVPDGVAREQVARIQKHTLNHVVIQSIPFLTQDDYDKLLWTCDVNFVRGEDSFVRAIWAGRPMVWQIYVQDEDAHLIKLRAFLERYSQNLNESDADSLAQFTVMWNVSAIEKDGPAVSRDFFTALPQLGMHAREWANTLAKQPDLASQIAHFIQTQRSMED